MPDYRTRVNNYSDDDSSYAPVLVETTTWRDELKEQFDKIINDHKDKIRLDEAKSKEINKSYLKVQEDLE